MFLLPNNTSGFHHDHNKQSLSLHIVYICIGMSVYVYALCREVCLAGVICGDLESSILPPNGCHCMLPLSLG